MRLRDWSGRRVAGMWVIAAAIEGLVITVGMMHPIVLETVPEGTSNVARLIDSGAPFSGFYHRADSLSDSALALEGRRLADSLDRSLVVAEKEAARNAMILAAVVLLSVPLAASAITTRWLLLRRRVGGAPPKERAAS